MSSPGRHLSPETELTPSEPQSQSHNRAWPRAAGVLSKNRRRIASSRNDSSSKAAASREYGSGGTHCDGCRADAEEAEDGLEVCERCRYAACGDCQVHHSRGTCFCKDANFGAAYPKKREWYMCGRW